VLQRHHLEPNCIALLVYAVRSEVRQHIPLRTIRPQSTLAPIQPVSSNRQGCETGGCRLAFERDDCDVALQKTRQPHPCLKILSIPPRRAGILHKAKIHSVVRFDRRRSLGRSIDLTRRLHSKTKRTKNETRDAQDSSRWSVFLLPQTMESIPARRVIEHTPRKLVLLSLVHRRPTFQLLKHAEGNCITCIAMVLQPLVA